MACRRAKGVSDRLKALSALLREKRPRSEVETACIQRLVRDLEGAGKNGLIWNEEEAQRNVSFVQHMRHWKGVEAGRRFRPAAWQEHAIIAPLFGWFRETPNGVRRRFTVSYVEVPRKNGKTLTSSLIANQGLIADREHGPEVYFAATTRDQASLGFRDAQNTIRNSPELVRRVKFFRNSTVCPANLGTLQAVSSDYNFLQGKNPSRVIVDELHAHKNRDVWDALLTGFGARQNPLLFSITTAGYDRTSVCWEQHEFGAAVAHGTIDEPTYHSFITCADYEDDPFDPEIWRKANPNFGVSVDPEFLHTEARKAQKSVSYENTFRRLFLNQWTSQNTRWVNLVEMWDPCAQTINWDEYRDRPCYAAFDLAATRDLSALAMLFPDEDNDTVALRVLYWMPRHAVSKRAEADRRQLEHWAKLGHIIQTDGDVADVTGQIPRDMFRELVKYDVKEVAYDPWGNAIAVCQQLHGLGVPESVFTQFSQSVRNYSPAVQEAERLMSTRKLLHAGNPCLRWQMDNVSMREDVNGNKRPDKSKSSDKIDGVVASLMAIACWANIDSTKRPSYYNNVDVLEPLE